MAQQTQVTCTRCEKQFAFDPTKFRSHCRIEFGFYCCKHERTYCDCHSDIYSDGDEERYTAAKKKYPWVKIDHPFVDGAPVLHCKKCEFDIEHTCTRCGEIVEEFSYSKICYDCDEDSIPGPGDIQCCCCHRTASEEYKGFDYCDLCI